MRDIAEVNVELQELRHEKLETMIISHKKEIDFIQTGLSREFIFYQDMIERLIPVRSKLNCLLNSMNNYVDDERLNIIYKKLIDKFNDSTKIIEEEIYQLEKYIALSSSLIRQIETESEGLYG